MDWRQAHHSLLVSFHLSSLRSVRGVLFDFYGPADICILSPLPCEHGSAPVCACAQSPQVCCILRMSTATPPRGDTLCKYRCVPKLTAHPGLRPGSGSAQLYSCLAWWTAVPHHLAGTVLYGYPQSELLRFPCHSLLWCLHPMSRGISIDTNCL
ncbi:hypothetical protein K466DRAFT_32390 [Polyporus arcularius HHB13444]|uniref:Uncharacterized protein n=1 Tax=Polyporus arcularius HHB13444 TaxID=1314778 RepID=A0A5C3NNE6_9APHY|nr:hypothetical protein K466DRAFT_32390 [Polyporus arcularius HHB13444]